MGKVVVTMFYSLDGMIDEPQHWTFDYWNDEIAKFKFDELLATDAHLLGRITYDGFAAAWPNRSEEDEFTRRMNSMPKYVPTRTLEKLEWNNSHVLNGDLAESIHQLKAQYDGDILVAGSATLVNSLIAENLVDEYRMLVFPRVLGKGKRLFTSNAKLKLSESKDMGSGVILLRYEPDANEV